MSLKQIFLIQEKVTSQQLDWLDGAGFDLIEEANIGEYDLALLRTSIYSSMGADYTLGFQRAGRNFIDANDQYTKIVPDNIEIEDLIQLPKIINGWLEQYGSIVIDSYNPRNIKVYKLLFSRYGMDINDMGGRGFIIS